MCRQDNVLLQTNAFISGCNFHCSVFKDTQVQIYLGAILKTKPNCKFIYVLKNTFLLLFHENSEKRDFW